MALIGSNSYFISVANPRRQREQQTRFGLSGGTIAVMNRRYWEQQELQKHQAQISQPNLNQQQRTIINGLNTDKFQMQLPVQTP